ncbi:MAG: TetR/AcrR family transcriptional regulator [bacterium]
MPPTKSGRVRKTQQRLSSAARKESFLQAASQLIRARGLEGLTMEGLAAFCEVNKALPYRHFANRDDLLVALYDYENRKFDERLGASEIDTEDFAASLRHLVFTWYADVKSGTGTPELMQARTQSGELEARRRVRVQTSVSYIADLVQSSYDVKRDKAKLAASVLLAGSQGLVAFWRTPGLDHEGLTESFIAMSVGAVAAIAEK